MEYREFSIHVPDPTNNIVRELLGLTNELEKTGDSMWRHPPQIQWLQNGRLHVALADTNSIITVSNVPTFRPTWFDYIPDFGSSNKLVAEVMPALSRPDFHSGFEPKNLYHKSLAWSGIHAGGTRTLMIAAILFSARDGNRPETLQRLRAFTNFISSMKNEPLVIKEAVRQAFATELFFVQWQLLQSMELTDPVLSEWQQFWIGQEFPKELAQALRIERALQFELLSQLSGTKGSQSEQLRAWSWADEIDNPIMRNPVTRTIGLSPWHLIWKEQDIVNGIENWNPLIKRLDIIAKGQIPSPSMSKTRVKKSWLSSYLFLFTNSDDLREYAGIPKTALRSETIRSLAIGGIAIHRYILRHGKPPASLDALKPDFLSDIPLDPFDRKPLRYLTDGKEWVLYSIGENVDDDGGQVEIGAPGREIRSIFDGADIVWPRPALPKQDTKDLQKN